MTDNSNLVRTHRKAGLTAVERAKHLHKRQLQRLAQAQRRDGLGAAVTTIDHPDHYGGDATYEAIKVIEAWTLGFNLGNAVKYISRHAKKGAPLEDLKKAAWYLNREIERLQKETLP